MVAHHLENERAANLKSTGPKEYFGQALDFFEYFWVRGWANEIFSDLFAIYTRGPAFAWSHFHLTAGRDHARMEAMLIGLDLLGFKKHATEI